MKLLNFADAERNNKILNPYRLKKRIPRNANLEEHTCRANFESKKNTRKRAYVV